jgi:ABC-2 type transport system ATP-binding protein
MDEAQYLAQRVAVIKGGEIVAEGPPDRLGGRSAMNTRIRFRLPAGAPGRPGLGESELPDGSFELSTNDPTRTTHELTGWALERGFSFDGFEVVRPSLEDVYLELTGAEEGAG